VENGFLCIPVLMTYIIAITMPKENPGDYRRESLVSSQRV
jgi:hypothetical protein